MARPNQLFAALISLGAVLAASIGWSEHNLILAGAPTLVAGGGWPGLECVLLPVAGDFAPHLASYVFLIAIGLGLRSGVASLLAQRRETRALLRLCLATRGPEGAPVELGRAAARLRDVLDVADLPAPLAFCYGYLRPRVLVTTGLVDVLDPLELEALLLHEWEYARQRDPLKVATGKLLSSAFFFVPLVGALYRRFLAEMDVAADRAAVAAQGTTAPLASALLRLVEHGDAPRPAAGAAGGALDVRVDALLGLPTRAPLRLDRAGLVVSVASLIVASLPVFAAVPPDAARLSRHSVVAVCHLDADDAAGS
jgi:Zn-dependent protease with chaperone function